jgi:hypothetical protein
VITRGNGRASDRQTAAADAHWGMGVVFDYYAERHNRNGIDGHGTPIYGRTHLGRRLDDAYCESRGPWALPASRPPNWSFLPLANKQDIQRPSASAQLNRTNPPNLDSRPQGLATT